MTAVYIGVNLINATELHPQYHRNGTLRVRYLPQKINLKQIAEPTNQLFLYAGEIYRH